jgi:hypothetical protein
VTPPGSMALLFPFSAVTGPCSLSLSLSCNQRDESSISCPAMLALTHGVSRLIYAQVRLRLPLPDFLHFVCTYCISCIRVLAVCAYYTLFFFSFALFAASNSCSLFETLPTTTLLALSSLFTRASLLQRPLRPISGDALSSSSILGGPSASTTPNLIVISPWHLSRCARHVYTA